MSLKPITGKDFAAILRALDAPQHIIAELLDVPASTMRGWVIYGVPGAKLLQVRALLDDPQTPDRIRAAIRARRHPDDLPREVPVRSTHLRDRVGMSAQDVAKARKRMRMTVVQFAETVGARPVEVAMWEDRGVPAWRTPTLLTALDEASR